MKKLIAFVIIISISVLLLCACEGVESVTITFNTNGGSNIDSITIDSLTSIRVPDNPTKDGYIFAGWYLDNDTFLEPANLLLEKPVASNIIVYAKWNPDGSNPVINDYTIVFNTNGGSDIDDLVISSGSVISLPADPTKADHTFQGWFFDELTSVAFNLNNINDYINNNTLALYAKWVSTALSTGLSYNLLSNDTYEVTGYDESNTTVLVPDTYLGKAVTAIGDYAFYQCDNIIELYLPNSLEIIGDFSFYQCEDLREIVIPDSVIEIGWGAFYDCMFLETVIFGSNLDIIENEAFGECVSIVEIDIPSSVTVIGSGAFWGCSALESIYVDVDNVNYKDIDGVLYNKSGDTLIQYPIGRFVTSYVVPNGTLYVESYSFGLGVYLESISLPNGVLEIGMYAFSLCSYLNTINLPNTLTILGVAAFNNCSSLNNISLPNSLTYIGASAFNGCSALTSIVIPNSITEIDEYTFTGCSSLASVVLSTNLTSIDDYAFSYCSALNNVIIPDTLTSIGWWVFRNCTSLTSVTVNAVTPPLMDRDVFTDANSNLIIYVPAGSVSAYQAANEWSDYSDIIQAIAD